MALFGFYSIAQLDNSLFTSHFLQFLTEIRFVTFFVFLYLMGSIQSPDAKRTQIRSYNVSLVKVQHEIKPVLMIKRFSMFFTSFTPDFLWAEKFQNQILFIGF